MKFDLDRISEGSGGYPHFHTHSAHIQSELVAHTDTRLLAFFAYVPIRTSAPPLPTAPTAAYCATERLYEHQSHIVWLKRRNDITSARDSVSA